MLFLTTRSGLLLPRPSTGVSAALRQSEDDDAEKGQPHRTTSDQDSLPRIDFVSARPVERGERPIALSALPGVEDEADDW